MTSPNDIGGTIHASARQHAAALPHWVAATPRPHGALRYRCPINDGFICVTDDATLAALDRPRARVRCPSCGEIHLLTQDDDTAAVPIVAASSGP